MPERSDQEILDLVKEDPHYFSLFYEKYFDTIYKFCSLKLNFNKELTEDIVSQVFLKSLENISKVKLKENDRGSLLPWLYTIARNLIYDHWRKGKTRKNVELDEEILSSKNRSMNDTAEEIDQESQSQKLKEAISELDDTASEIVFMKVYEERNFNEIAKLKKMNESAVKMRYYRAIEKVAKKVTVDRSG